MIGQYQDELDNRIRKILAAHAKENKTITYGELGEAVNLRANHWFLNTALRILSKESHEQECGMLSVVVVRKDTELPGKGFFKQARELNEGKPAPADADEREFWRAEFDKVCEKYQR